MPAVSPSVWQVTVPSLAMARIDEPTTHVPETRAWITAVSTASVNGDAAVPAPLKRARSVLSGQVRRNPLDGGFAERREQSSQHGPVGQLIRPHRE